jgi:hypothetical protein
MSGNKDDCWCLRHRTASGDEMVQWSSDCPVHGIKPIRATVFAFDDLRLVFPEVTLHTAPAPPSAR